MSINIHVNDANLVRAINAAPAAINAALDATVTGITLDAEGGVIAATPVGATGHARQAIAHQFNGSGLMTSGRVFSSDMPIKTASLEHGRRPGKMPPRGPIELWVARKLGIGGPEGRSVAFLIARSIGRRGTKGAHMFSKGADVARASAAKRMPALRAAIGRVL